MTLPDRPALKRHLFATTIEQEDVFVLSEDQAWLWKNRALAQLLPGLDGKRTLSDLFDLAGPEVTPTEVIYLLSRLQDLGLLAEGGMSDTPRNSDADLAYWHALGVEEKQPWERVRHSPVALRVLGQQWMERFLVDALEAAHVRIADRGQTAFEVVVTDHYFRPELNDVNAAALATRTAWMLCKLVGQTLWIGPIFRPGHTGCLACLQDRLRHNRQLEDFVVRKTGDPAYYLTSAGASPALTRLGTIWAAQELALWLAGRAERLEGKLLSVEMGPKGLAVAIHPVVRRPQCATCGTGEYGGRPIPIVLRRRPVTAEMHRSESPAVTLQRLSHHISPLTGIVTWLADLTNDSEELVNCYSAGHSFALGPDTTYWLRQGMRSRTGGKGATAAQGKTSAVCEAIERYTGVFRSDVFRIRGTYEQLAERAVHPTRCLNFSSRQYDRREELNADGQENFLNLIPRRFPEQLEIDWAPLWSLTAEETRYLPAALCYYAHPDVEHHFYCAGDSNGCAAGSVLEEAILSGFLELVERDAAAIWWYNQLPRPAVDLDSVSDEYLARVRERYERLRRELWAIDLTSDLGIPAIVAVSRRVDGPTEDLLVGFGAHLDPSIALRQAVIEVNQFLPAVTKRKGNGQTIYAWPDDVAIRFWQTETLASQHHLVPDRSVTSRAISDFPHLSSEDLYDDLHTCLQICRGRNLDLMVLDQSRADIDLSVVRVVVPGLRHFWRRLGPGRLYDVPVDLGWLASPKSEDELNPTSIFF